MPYGPTYTAISRLVANLYTVMEASYLLAHRPPLLFQHTSGVQHDFQCNMTFIVLEKFIMMCNNACCSHIDFCDMKF